VNRGTKKGETAGAANSDGFYVNPPLEEGIYPMIVSTNQTNLNRRRFLKGTALIAATPLLPATVAQAEEFAKVIHRDDRDVFGNGLVGAVGMIDYMVYKNEPAGSEFRGFSFNCLDGEI
jgi:hypothetical protein